MKSDLLQPIYLSVPEAAKLCGVSRNTLYTWVRKGKLGAYQTPGRTNLIRPTDLVSFMQESGLFVPSGLLDLAQQDEASHAPVTPTGSETEAGSILVVDDDPGSRGLVLRALSKHYRLHQAQTGFQALHLLTLHKEISMVILDMRMPGQHGAETLGEIKKLRPDVAVLILTGFAADVPEELKLTGQITRVIEKPITVAKLQEVIDTEYAKLKR